MKAIIKQSIYAILICAGIGGVLFLLSQNKRVCINTENVCFSYHPDWKPMKVTDPGTIRIAKSSPGALFQIAVSHNKIAGDIKSITAGLDSELRKKLKSYKLISANQIAIDGIRSIEMTYEFMPKENGRSTVQQLILTPLGDHSYFITTETAPSNLDKLQPEFDFFLSQVEIKR